jgi:hypothetical protein
MERDEHGVCEECSSEIGVGRLEPIPWAPPLSEMRGVLGFNAAVIVIFIWSRAERTDGQLRRIAQRLWHTEFAESRRR